MTEIRLLVTGSREWDHQGSIVSVLAHYARVAHGYGHRLRVVHGKAARGLDALAATWVKESQLRGWPVDQDPHAASWSAPCAPDCRPGHRQQRGNGSDYCPFAGFRRNQQMVDTRPLLCVGFHRGGSSGTRDCMKRAERAGIPVFKILWSQRDLVDPTWLAEHALPLGVG